MTRESKGLVTCSAKSATVWLWFHISIVCILWYYILAIWYGRSAIPMKLRNLTCSGCDHRMNRDGFGGGGVVNCRTKRPLVSMHVPGIRLLPCVKRNHYDCIWCCQTTANSGLWWQSLLKTMMYISLWHLKNRCPAQRVSTYVRAQSDSWI